MDGQTQGADYVPPRPTNNSAMPRTWSEAELRSIVADQFRNEFVAAKAAGNDITKEPAWKKVALYGGVAVGGAVVGATTVALINRRRNRMSAMPMKPVVNVSTK